MYPHTHGVFTLLLATHQTAPPPPPPTITCECVTHNAHDLVYTIH